MQLCTTLAALANNCKKFLRIFTSNFFNNYTRKVEQTESRYGFLVSMCLLLLQGEKCTHENFCQLPFTIMLVYTYVYVCRHIFKLRFRQTIKILSLQFNLQNFHWHKSKAWSQMNFWKATKIPQIALQKQNNSSYEQTAKQIRTYKQP